LKSRPIRDGGWAKENPLESGLKTKQN